MTVCIGNVNPGLISCATVRSMLEAGQGNVSYILFREAGPYIQVARNYVVEKFLKERDEEWLLFVDSDIVFTPDDINNLVALGTPERLVSGLYLNNTTEWGIRPVAGRWSYNERYKCESIIPIEQSVLTDDVDDEGLVKVDGLGAGFLLIHRTVIQNLLDAYGYPMPWFDELVLERTRQWVGEDYVFCMRAGTIGVPSYVVPSIKVGHIKSFMY